MTDFVLFGNTLVPTHDILSLFEYAQKSHLNATADVMANLWFESSSVCTSKLYIFKQRMLC